jgi:chemotaxis protein MotA
MTTWIGLVVVIGAVLGGFAMAGGPFAVLVQPSEVVVIGGAAIGTLIISAPGIVGKRVLHALGRGFKGDMIKRGDNDDLLRLLYDLFQVVRREGMLSMEQHVDNPKDSAIFKKYPSVLKRHHAVELLTGGLRQLVDGCPVHELTLLFESEMETRHAEEHQPLGLLRATSDSLPGLGIVAAVLGIVVTMGHMDGGAEVIGHHVAAALVGTFLGILMCYGMLSPIVTSVENQMMVETRYMLAIRDGLLSSARGNTPQLSVEFARRAMFGDERPNAQEVITLLEKRD